MKKLLGAAAGLALVLSPVAVAATAQAAPVVKAAPVAHSHPLSYYAPNTGAITAALMPHAQAKYEAYVKAQAASSHGLALIANEVPLVGSHLQNTSQGGCAKDVGFDDEYQVAACATASNFTEEDNLHTYYYEFHDGTGNCMTEAGYPTGYMKAGTCAGADTQELQPPLNNADANEMYTYFDIQHCGGGTCVDNFLNKGGAYPYNVLDNSTGQNLAWAYPGA